MAFITEKIIYPDLDDPTITKIKKYTSELSGGVLLIREVVISEDNQETEVLVMEQPWKCHPNGSRENFVNETDAAVWLESVKDSFLR